LSLPHIQTFEIVNPQNDISIQVTLPKVSLINGIWWSTYFKDWKTGYILKFGSISYSLTTQAGSSTLSFSAGPSGEALR
jgi:hypothetical protein